QVGSGPDPTQSVDHHLPDRGVVLRERRLGEPFDLGVDQFGWSHPSRQLELLAQHADETVAVGLRDGASRQANANLALEIALYVVAADHEPVAGGQPDQVASATNERVGSVAD